MQKKSLLLIGLVFIFIISASFAYAACPDNQRIMRLSSVSNAHGEVYNYSVQQTQTTTIPIPDLKIVSKEATDCGLGKTTADCPSGYTKISSTDVSSYDCWTNVALCGKETTTQTTTNSTNYPVEICYNEIFGKTYSNSNPHLCNATNRILSLSSNTNAHAETITGSYNVDVCYGDLTCIVKPSCGTGEQAVVTLSSTTNSHLAVSGYYYKICCKTSQPVTLSLNDAYWTDTANTRITQTSVGNTVNMVAEGVPDGTLINFDLKKNGILIDTKQATITSGKAGVTWTANATGTYNFNASVAVNPGISIISGNLDVITGCIRKTCAEIRGILGNAKCGNFTDSLYTCGGSRIECGCGTGEECILDTGQTTGSCAVIAGEINFCQDYTNQTSCNNFLPLVAKNTWEDDVENKGAGFCGSPSTYQLNPACNYNVTCKCYWDITQDICGHSRDTVTYGCADAGNLGTCNAISSIMQECNELGTRLINLSYYWQGTGATPTDCSGSAIVERKCVATVQLDFFTTLQLIIAILIIIIFYLIVLQKRKQFKKRKKVSKR